MAKKMTTTRATNTREQVTNKRTFSTGNWARENFRKAIQEVCLREKKQSYEVMADWIQANPHKMLEIMAKFEVMHVAVDIGQNLADIIGELDKRSNAASSSDRVIEGSATHPDVAH